MVKAAVMGYDTIGSGMAEMPDKNRGVIASQAGQEVELGYVPDLRKFPGSSMVGKITHDFKVIEQDEEVKIMVETMGGLNPVYPFVKVRLMTDRNMVTPNKVLVVAHGTELLAIAKEKYANPLSGASVGGGIPIIHPFYRCLMGERIEEITGILNGATNFILTKTDKEGESFRNVLRETQSLGCTECNPEADVEGHDTCRKITILIVMATGKEVSYGDIYIEDVTWITDVDFKYTEEMETLVRLSGTSQIEDGKVLAYVAPVMINKTNPLYSVSDVFNDILVKGNVLDTSAFYSSGAGKLPTGNAVVADIIEVAQNLEKNVLMDWTDEKQAIESMDQARFGYFVRAAGSYRNRKQDVRNAFGQVEAIELYGVDEFAFLIAQMTEGEFRKATVSYDSKEQERSEYGIR